MPQHRSVADNLSASKRGIGALVKEVLKDGTPDWIKFPNDYRNWLEEGDEEERERSSQSAKAYQMENQHELTDEDSSLRNFMDTNTFLDKLRAGGIKVKAYQNPQLPQTAGLYAIKPGYEQLDYIFVTSMQVPVMPEWSLLREEEHFIPNGEAAIGWRQVLVMLAMKEIADETTLHKIFGEPNSSKRSRRYRRTMYGIRNGKFRKYAEASS